MSRVDKEEAQHDNKVINPDAADDDVGDWKPRMAEDYIIVDINFGKRSENDSKHLSELYVLSNEVDTFKKELEDETDDQTKEGLKEKIAEKQAEYDEKYQEML